MMSVAIQRRTIRGERRPSSVSYAGVIVAESVNDTRMFLSVKEFEYQRTSLCEIFETSVTHRVLLIELQYGARGL